MKNSEKLIQYRCKIIRFTASALVAFLFATALALGIRCLLDLLSISFGASPDAGASPLQSSYPRFVPFCRITGVASLVAATLLVVLNVKIDPKLEYTDKTWKFQAIAAAAMLLPLVKFWEIAFDFLQKTF